MFTFVSDSVSQILEVSREQLLADPALLTRLIHPEDISHFKAAQEETAGTGAWNWQGRMKLPSGRVCWIEAASRQDAEDAGRWEGVIMDVTERVKLEHRLEHTDRLANVGALAAGVAHEVNNPLTYTIGNLRYVLDQLKESEGLLDEESIAALRESLEGAERVQRLALDLRNLSRCGAEMRRETVDLEDLIRASVAVAHNEIRHKARLVAAYGAMPPVIGDADRLGQVFLNLLVNAAQSIPEGAPESNEIRVGARPVGEHLEIIVSDTGVGISPEKLDQIFDPFFTTRSGGLGLGLALCNSIVQRLGGEIRVASRPGRGTTFRVLLPMAERRVSVVSAPADLGAVDHDRRRVLIIDDEPFVLRTLSRALRQHEVITTTSGREALKLLSKERFDNILCDVMMPGIDGVAVLERVRARWPEMVDRFVFMTGGTVTAETRDYIETVHVPVLRKPFGPDELLNAIAGEAAASRQAV